MPRFLRLGVRERIKPDGSIHTKLDNTSLDEAINKLREEKVTSVAVCYLHAYKEPKHEQETKKILEAKLPGVSVSISSEVFPEIKEYERVSTTIVNAYVRPIVENYLNRLEEGSKMRATRVRY